MGSSLALVQARSPRVEAIWRDLEAQAQPSYFLSWGWVENWLACLPRDETPPLAVVHDDDGALAAAFFLGRHRIRHGGIFPSRAYYLNCTGRPERDELCIEDNGILFATGRRRPFASIVDLLPDDWDELYLPGIAPETLEVTSSADRWRVRVDRASSAPFVDLGEVRARGDYLKLLGSSTRAQIRRARRVAGELTVEVGSDPAHALDIYQELVRLHEQRWSARGAFAHPWRDGFHRRLITTRQPHGDIQLMRIRANGETLGCLYGYLSGDRVLFYQSGLARSSDPHMKPGYVCHAAAVEYNARAGHGAYDLLAGDGRYKKSLATGERRLVWLRLQRPRLRFTIEDRLREWKRALFPPIASSPKRP